MCVLEVECVGTTIKSKRAWHKNVAFTAASLFAKLKPKATIESRSSGPSKHQRSIPKLVKICITKREMKFFQKLPRVIFLSNATVQWRQNECGFTSPMYPVNVLGVAIVTTHAGYFCNLLIRRFIFQYCTPPGLNSLKSNGRDFEFCETLLSILLVLFRPNGKYMACLLKKKNLVAFESTFTFLSHASSS